MIIRVQKTDEFVKKMLEDLGQKAEPEVVEKVSAKVEKALGLKNKVSITVRLDPDIIAFFKDGGTGYQVRINAALREYVDRHKS